MNVRILQPLVTPTAMTQLVLRGVHGISFSFAFVPLKIVNLLGERFSYPMQGVSHVFVIEPHAFQSISKLLANRFCGNGLPGFACILNEITG